MSFIVVQLINNNNNNIIIITILVSNKNLLGNLESLHFYFYILIEVFKFKTIFNYILYKA